MDIINNEKKYPQLVEVVNNSANPTNVAVANLPLQGDSAVYVNVRNSPMLQGVRPQSSYFHVQLDTILILQSNGGFFAIPLNTTLTNITNSNLNNALASYKTAYATLVSGVTAATLHYSKMNSSGVTTSEVYNLKD